MAERRTFKPENGAQARVFETAWCERCSRHGGPADISGCGILFAAALLDAQEPGYPEAWVFGDAGPECTAFTPALIAPAATNHPDYARGFLDATGFHLSPPAESGFGYFAGYFSGLASRAIFERANVLVTRGGVGILAEARS